MVNSIVWMRFCSIAQNFIVEIFNLLFGLLFCDMLWSAEHAIYWTGNIHLYEFFSLILLRSFCWLLSYSHFPFYILVLVLTCVRSRTTCAWFIHTHAHIELQNVCCRFVSVFACMWMCLYIAYMCCSASLWKNSLRSSCLHFCRCFAHMNRPRLAVRFGNSFYSSL